jgi:hypothetical protein
VPLPQMEKMYFFVPLPKIEKNLFFSIFGKGKGGKLNKLKFIQFFYLCFFFFVILK